MALTTNANNDTISFAINPTTAAAAMDIADFKDVDADGIENGQVLVWNSSTNKFEAGDQTGSGGGGSNVGLTDFSVTTATPSGNGSLTYNNSGVFTFTPADTSGGGGAADQTLSISGNVITISGNNDTVDLTAMLAPYSKTDTDSQDLTISGNVISLTGQSGNVDLTSALGAVQGSYGDDDVLAYISGGVTPAENMVLTYSGDDPEWAPVQHQSLSISGNVISLTNQSGNVDLTSLLASGGIDTAGVDTHLNTSGASSGQVLSWNGSDYAWVVDNDAQTLSWNAGTSSLAVSGGNNVDLSALEQTLSISGNVITISGNNDTVDLTTALAPFQTTTAAGTANTNMKAYVDAEINTLIGGANVNLDSLGEVANALANSNTELSTVAFTGTFSDLQSRPDIALSGSDLTYDGTTLDLSGVGAVGPQGPQGSTGATGNGITTAQISGDNLLLTYSNTSTQNLGNIKGSIGPTGATGTTGATGVGVTSATVNGSGNLLLTLSNSSTVDAGNVRGAAGAVDQTLSVSGNVITISGNNDTVDLTTMLAPYSKTDTDAQDLTISGNVISLTGQSGNVDLTSVLGAVNTDAQDLTISGNVISLTGQSGNVDLTSLLVAGNYDNADVDAHLNQSNPTSGHVLSWNGSDYAWVAQSGGGSSDVVDDTTPQLGGDLDVNGKDIVTTSNANIDLNPNGSGQVVFRGNGTRGAGQFTLNCEANSHGVTIKGPAHSAGATYTLTLPDDDGSADQVLKTDGSGNLAWVDQSSGGGGGALTIQDEGSALSTAGTTLNFVGAGVTASGTGASKTISIPGGSGIAVVQRFKLNYDSSGGLDSTSDLTSLISSATISSDIVTVTFDGSINYPPASIMVYGYDYTNNKYLLVPLETTMSTREIAGGGSSGSPTLFGGSATISLDLRLREAETGASRSFGTTTHAWIEFVVYD
jgi:hypothetical protein